MADKKISALNAATTPLAGTEVLPIVQSGSTVKVSIADVTAGRAVSASALTASSGNLTFSATGQRITGDCSNATAANRLAVQTTTANANTNLHIIPNGTGTAAGVNVETDSSLANGQVCQMVVIKDTEARLVSTIRGSGAYVPLSLFAGGSARLTCGTTGNITAAGVYAATVGVTNRDVYVDDTGLLGYVTSTLASKTNIADFGDASWVHALRPVTFNYRKRDETGAYTDEAEAPTEFGLIAEEVEAVSPEIVFYDQTENGLELRGVSYSKLIIPLLAEVQALRTRIEALEAK